MKKRAHPAGGARRGLAGRGAGPVALKAAGLLAGVLLALGAVRGGAHRADRASMIRIGCTCTACGAQFDMTPDEQAAAIGKRDAAWPANGVILFRCRKCGELAAERTVEVR